MKRLIAALLSVGMIGGGVAVPLVLTAQPAAAATSCGAPVVSAGTATVTCPYTGDAQTWTVPQGVTSASFDVQGAQGGNGSETGGSGGRAVDTLNVTPGAVVNVFVGGAGADGGFNGGGSTAASVGGGASDIRIGGTALSDRVLIAGGGGGGAIGPANGTGGGGGGLVGESGSIGSVAGGGGAGGNQTGSTGSGTQGSGGGGSTFNGGGGGGGYWGGAAGQMGAAAGGGGSGFPVDATFTTGYKTGDGQVTISYTNPTPDTTAPTTTITLNPASPNGSNNWYKSSVGVSFTASDPDDAPSVLTTRCALDPASAPATFDDLPSGACSLSSVGTDGQHTIYAASEDPAGNKETPVSSNFKIDQTAPVTTISLSPSSPNGSNNWYTSAVGVSINASDATSGIDQTRCALDPPTPPASFDDLQSGPCPSSVTSDRQHTIYAASEDQAGNKEAVQSAGFAIDQTAPSLAPTLNPSTIYLNQTGVTASPNATDATSGVASSSCGAIDTSTAGDHTVTCTATDNAGNTNTATVHYTVQYKVLGFSSPASGSSRKAGKAVPVNIALGDVNGVQISDAEAAGLASACQVTFSAGGAQALAPQCMKYNAPSHQFVFTWKLAKTPTGAETITVAVSYPGTVTTTTSSEPITITS